MIIKDNLKNNKFNILLFDIDGTLVEYTSLSNLVKETLSYFDILPTEKLIINQGKAVGKLLELAEYKKVFSFNMMCEYWNDYMNLEYYDINSVDLAVKMLNLEVLYLKKVNGVQKTLELLSEEKRMIASTNWFLFSQRRKLDYIGLSEYIKKIYTCELQYAKPSAKHFKRILQEENISPDNILMIGDSSTDLSSEKVGIQSILVDYHNKKENIYDEASCVITEFSDLMKVLKL